jgi:hypothetical protein
MSERDAESDRQRDESKEAATHPTPEDEATDKDREDSVDETAEDTFPASDPPAW